MSLLEAVVLGVVQGITEWLPISSSGHLAVLQMAWGYEESVTLDAVLHLGTLLALIVRVRKPLSDLIRGFFFVAGRKIPVGPAEEKLRKDGVLALMVLVGTIPAAVTGLLLESVVEEAFTSYFMVGLGLILTAALLAWTGTPFRKEGKVGEKKGVKEKKEEKVRKVKDVENVKKVKKVKNGFFHNGGKGISVPGNPGPGPLQAFIIGCFQALALFPGVSRSGSTIAGGLGVGLRDEDALRFSLFLFIPAVIGANILVLKDGVEGISFVEIAAGFLTSFVVGYACLRLLEKIVSSRKLHWFAPYCLMVGVLLFAKGLGLF